MAHHRISHVGSHDEEPECSHVINPNYNFIPTAFGHLACHLDRECHVEGAPRPWVDDVTNISSWWMLCYHVLMKMDDYHEWIMTMKMPITNVWTMRWSSYESRETIHQFNPMLFWIHSFVCSFICSFHFNLFNRYSIQEWVDISRCSRLSPAWSAR